MYDRVITNVRIIRGETDALPITRGIHQECFELISVRVSYR